MQTCTSLWYCITAVIDFLSAVANFPNSEVTECACAECANFTPRDRHAQYESRWGHGVRYKCTRLAEGKVSDVRLGAGWFEKFAG